MTLKRFLPALFFLFATAEAASSWYRPTLFTTWQIQLTDTLNTSYAAQLYDFDLFDTPQETIDALHAQGRRVICYFSAGSYENWRDDAVDFPEEALGNDLSGWPGEKWLDIRNATVRTIMTARMDVAVQKGCDGVDPDNVDGYTNNTGFPLTANDQKTYDLFLATEAHARGLSVGLKNALDLIPELVDAFDFQINEQCREYDECDLLAPFIAAGKPVFNIEYNTIYDDPEEFKTLCADAKARRFATLYMPDNLDGSFRHACPLQSPLTASSLFYLLD